MKVSLYGPARHPRAKEAQPQEVISTGRQHHLGAALRAAPVSFFSTKPRCPRPSCRIGYVCISDSGGRARKTAITILIQKYGEVINLARKDIKSNAQMWMPPPAASQIKISSMNISQTTSGQHIPARKANRSLPIPFASCAIFVNVTTLLNPSTAEQIPKDRKSNNPSVASCGLG